MQFTGVSKALILAGALLVAAGVAWAFLGPLFQAGGALHGKLPPLGKLPGDIAVERGSARFYFPLGTSIVASVVLSLLAWVFGKFGGR